MIEACRGLAFCAMCQLRAMFRNHVLEPSMKATWRACSLVRLCLTGSAHHVGHVSDRGLESFSKNALVSCCARWSCSLTTVFLPIE